MASLDSKEYVSVSDFYEGKSIFVTGATGFLGKLLVEKLLWSCPGIEKIYLLIRRKKNEDEESRLATVLRTPVFDRIRKSRPNDLKKIALIPGDLSKSFLNISIKYQEILTRTVAVVFHVAATVRFNEPLKESVTINTTATKHLVEFCYQMANLKAFVHVSTAYSNCDREEVKEEIYNSPHDPETIIRLVEIMDDDIIDGLAPKLLDKRPNTYTYTKALAENVLQRHNNKLPIAIVRPSIVLSTLKEPIPGWIDSWNGPSSFVAAGSKGLLHGLLGDPNIVGDMIPADVVVNLTICVAWHTAMKAGIASIEVYNCCTGKRNPVTWGTFMKCCYAASLKSPSGELFTYPLFSLQRHRSTRFIQKLFLEQIPSFTIDMIHHLAGKKAVMLHIHDKLMKVNDALLFVMMRQWKFLDNNTQNLLSLLSKEDRQIFPFDVCDIHWPTFLEIYYLGIRQYLLKDNPDTVNDARKRLERLKWMNLYVPFLLIIFAILYLAFIF